MTRSSKTMGETPKPCWLLYGPRSASQTALPSWSRAMHVYFSGVRPGHVDVVLVHGRRGGGELLRLCIL